MTQTFILLYGGVNRKKLFDRTRFEPGAQQILLEFTGAHSTRQWNRLTNVAQASQEQDQPFEAEAKTAVRNCSESSQLQVPSV